MERQFLRHHARAGTRRDRVLYREESCRRALGEGVLAQVLSFIEGCYEGLHHRVTETQRKTKNSETLEPVPSSEQPLKSTGISVLGCWSPRMKSVCATNCICVGCPLSVRLTFQFLTRASSLTAVIGST